MKLHVGAVILAMALGLMGCREPTENEPSGQFRVFLAIPDAGRLDVLLDRTTLLNSAGFKTGSQYRATAGGAHLFELRASGTSEIVHSKTHTVVTGEQQTIVYGGTRAAIDFLLFSDTNTAPAAGRSRLRVINASSENRIDVYVTAPDADITNVAPAVSALTYGAASSYLEIAPGTYQVRATTPGSKSVVFVGPSVTLEAGQVRTSIAVPGSGGTAATFVTLRDNTPS